MATPTISIDFDIPCKRCGQPGASKNGLCMKCLGNALKKGEFAHLFKSKPKSAPPMKSTFLCPVCKTPLTKESDIGGVGLYCAYGPCTSLTAEEGISGEIEQVAYEKLVALCGKEPLVEPKLEQ